VPRTGEKLGLRLATGTGKPESRKVFSLRLATTIFDVFSGLLPRQLVIIHKPVLCGSIRLATIERGGAVIFYLYTVKVNFQNFKRTIRNVLIIVAVHIEEHILIF
jgi:hypothetical protein